MREERRETIRLDRRFDWVGPPDAVSKIRPIRLRRLVGESAEEASYRLQREKLNDWNSNFWSEHNQLFDAQKAAFVEKRKSELRRIESVSAADMSMFYKRFLDSRRETLASYNRGKRLKFSSSIQRGAELAVMETSSFKKKVRNVIERMVSKKSVADLASNASAVT